MVTPRPMLKAPLTSQGLELGTQTFLKHPCRSLDALTQTFFQKSLLVVTSK